MSAIEISESQSFPSVLNVKRGPELRRYVPERTCHYVGDEISGGCSECRGWLDPACSYCPSCGARVVSDE